MDVFFLAAAFVVTLVYRIFLFRRFKKHDPEGDEISHLMMLKAVCNNGNRIPESISQFVLNYNDYPNGFHKLAAMTGLPLTFWERQGGWVPIICDMLLLVWIGGFVALTGGHSYEWLLLFPFIRLLWGREARSHDFGERAFGVLFGNIYLGAAFLFSQTHHWIWLPLAATAFALAAPSSKFTNQAMLFFTLLLWALTQDAIYPFIYLGSLAVAVIVTRGYVLKVLRGQIIYLVHYRLHRMQRTLRRNFYQDLLQAFQRFKLSRFRFYLFENPLFMLLTNCPPNLAFLAIWAINGFPVDALTVYAFCGNILVLLIATEPLKYLGQPERYLEFSLPQLFALLARYPAKAYGTVCVVSVLIGASAMAYHMNHFLKRKQEQTLPEKSYEELGQFLESQPEATLLTIPLKCANFLAYRSGKHHYVTNFTHCRNRSVYEAYERLMPDHYPFPGNWLENYVHQFGIRMIVVRKASVGRVNQLAEQSGSKVDYYNFSAYPSIFENGDFIVYQAKPDKMSDVGISMDRAVLLQPVL